MANTTSAKKATRKIARRTVVNKARRTKLRSAVRSVEEAIKSGDRNAAATAMKRAEPELMKSLDLSDFQKQLRRIDAMLSDIEEGKGRVGEFVQGEAV